MERSGGTVRIPAGEITKIRRTLKPKGTPLIRVVTAAEEPETTVMRHIHRHASASGITLDKVDLWMDPPDTSGSVTAHARVLVSGQTRRAHVTLTPRTRRGSHTQTLGEALGNMMVDALFFTR